MKNDIKIFIGLIVGALIIGVAIYIKPVPILELPEYKIIRFPECKETKVILDLKDRENGICAEMYADGYKWGLGQIPLQISIWRLEKYSESEIKELLYDMLYNWKK